MKKNFNPSNYAAATESYENAHAAFLATREAEDRANSIADTLRNAMKLIEQAAKCDDTPNISNKFLDNADRTAEHAINLAEKTCASLTPFVPAERLASSRKFFAFSRKTRAFQVSNTIGAIRKLAYACMLTNIIRTEIDNPDFGKHPTFDTASSFVANLESVISIIRLARSDILNTKNKGTQPVC